MAYFAVISGHELKADVTGQKMRTGCGPSHPLSPPSSLSFGIYCYRNPQNFCLYFLASVGHAAGQALGAGGARGAGWSEVAADLGSG